LLKRFDIFIVKGRVNLTEVQGQNYGLFVEIRRRYEAQMTENMSHSKMSLNILNLSIFLLLHFLGLRLWDLFVNVDLFCGDLWALVGSSFYSSILSL
jgi:hypothetical protein